MTWFALTPVLAAPVEIYRLLILAFLALGGTVLKKISDAREQAERAKAAKPPAARPPAMAPPRRENEVRGSDAAWPANAAEPAPSPRRDNPFRNEIEAFLEEVGRRRSPSDGPQRGAATERGAMSAGPPLARPVARQQTSQSTPAPVQRTASSAGRPKSEPPKAVPPAAPPSAPPPQRLGAEIALRKAPVSDDLGAQVRAHLSQYLESSRLSQRAKADLGSAVERAIRQHMGNTTTRGTDSQDSFDAAVQAGAPIAALLRSPAGVRTAILVNEILERPKCLRRKT